MGGPFSRHLKNPKKTPVRPTMAVSKLSPLTQLFVKISNCLSEDDVRNLRAILVQDGIGLANLEQATPLEMFNMLEDNNKIGKGDLQLFVQERQTTITDTEVHKVQTNERDQQEILKKKEMEKRQHQLFIQQTRDWAFIICISFFILILAVRVSNERSRQPQASSTVITIEVLENSVESLPCFVTVTVTTVTADLTGGKVAPQIEVTSPRGKTTLIQTTAHTSPPLEAKKGQTSRVSRVWGAEWRPQESGKHTLGACMGGRKDLCSLTVTVDVGSNNPIMSLGQKGSQQGQFDSPVGVAVRGDRLYVADTYNNRVQVFDLSGKFCHSFPTDLPVGLAVQTDGTIVVNSGKEVKKFSPSGELLHKFPLGDYWSDPLCIRLNGLAVQRDGRVVVADGDKHSIFLFETDGTLVKQVRGQGEGDGQFDWPCFVCVDKEDNIIVADSLNHRVQVFDRNLNFKHKFGQKGRQPQDMWDPSGVSADSMGNIVLANSGELFTNLGGAEHGKKLQVFRADGTWVSTISSDGDKLNVPFGVAVTEDGHVFVADYGDHCIRKYRYI
ncbi:hypothetical protein Bbelb_082300 [Branchiostoma belcheri]|nr:hypothetical protein Bbelb_082300 [Branchiostoma belcheri]